MTEQEMYDGFFQWVDAVCPVFTIPKIGKLEAVQWSASDIVCEIKDRFPGNNEFYINMVFEEWAKTCGYVRDGDKWEYKGVHHD